MENLNDKIAIVTGANRGIGLEVVRQLARLGAAVILGSRELGKGEQAAAPIIADGLKVLPRRLDVTDQKSVEALKDQVEAEFGRLDILINNAAILYDSWQRGVDADLEVVRQAFETNTLGPWRMCKAFIPLLRRSKSGGEVSKLPPEDLILAAIISVLSSEENFRMTTALTEIWGQGRLDLILMYRVHNAKD